MPSVEKHQRLQGLVARITLKPRDLEIRIRSAYLADLLRSGEVIGACQPMALPDEPVLVLTIAARLKRTGMEKKFVIGAASEFGVNLGCLWALSPPRPRMFVRRPPRECPFRDL